MATQTETSAPRSRWVRMARNTSMQVLIMAIAGAIFGLVWPDTGANLKIIADLFISLVQLVIAPIVFLVVVTGIVQAGGMKAVGRIALKAIIYFEVVTTIGMLIGLAAVNIFKPGEGVAPPAKASGDLKSYVKDGSESFTDILKDIVPNNAVGAFSTGHVLQVLIFAILFAIALIALPDQVSEPIVRGCGKLAQVFFRMISMIMYIAPIGAFGAVAYTVGKYGPETLTALMKLVGVSVLALAVFIVFVLGGVMRFVGASLLKLIRALRKEISVVLGTSSSESVMPQVMDRLEGLGCKRTVVGLVVPTGYSFNLDGVAVVIPICVVFIGQVYGVPLSFGDQLVLFLVFLILSKGTAGVSGSAFVTLANTVAATALVPIAGLALVLSVDRFLSLVRAVTNVLGNAVATIVVARWEPDGIDDEEALQAIAR
jgi:aerobic C4-dicarboxylate transport protein